MREVNRRVDPPGNRWLVPGVRAIQVSGAPPTILPGRDGSQYLAYMQAQIEEMYQVAMLEEEVRPIVETTKTEITVVTFSGLAIEGSPTAGTDDEPGPYTYRNWSRFACR